MLRVSDVVSFLQRFAPPALAASWDNTGLLLGEANQTVSVVLTCLTVTPRVVQEAVQTGAQLIVSHHPILFKGTKNLSSLTAEGRLLLPLLRNGISVYSPHTSYDNCMGGINDQLAVSFRLREVRPLRWLHKAMSVKLVAMIPDGAVEVVSNAMFQAGAGRIGAYEQCSFRSTGTGTFFGNETTNPVVGTKCERVQVPEQRLEVVVPESRVEDVVSALKAVHPYEEPAFDIYPLRANRLGGEGRIGLLESATTLSAFTALVKQACAATAVQVVGDATHRVRAVALACGSAGEFLHDAQRAGADVFVTGECRYHDALAAESLNMAMILIGHDASERPAVAQLARIIAAEFPTLHCRPSQSESDPLRWH